MTSPSGRNFHLKTEGQKWHVPFCPIFLTCCCETCWGNIFCSSNYWKGQQPRGCSKLNVLSKPSMSIPSAPQVHTKYLWHSCCQLRIFWTHWAIFEFTAVYDAKRNRTEEVLLINYYRKAGSVGKTGFPCFKKVTFQLRLGFLKKLIFRPRD